MLEDLESMGFSKEKILQAVEASKGDGK